MGVRRAKHQPGSFLAGRARVVFCCLFAAYAILTLRAVTIHLFPAKQNSLNQMANRQYKQSVELARYRGDIFDAQGETLALSIRKSSFFINPKLFSPNAKQRLAIRRILGVSSAQLRRAMRRPGYFAWLKRKVSRTASAKLAKLQIKGVHRVLEPARFYPNGSTAANLLGYVGLDDQGLAGIERRFNTELSGEPIHLDSHRDAKGHMIFDTAKDAAPEQRGDAVFLTIDRVIQDIAEQALRDGVRNANAKGGFAIVSDPHTGRVLAVANAPSFNPNRWQSAKALHRKNFAFANAFEPGSVIKPLIVGAALDKSLINLNSRYDCEGGRIKIGRHTVRDSHKPESQKLDVPNIVKESSNVCMYKLALDIGPEALHQGLRQFGIGKSRQKLGYPGEAGGVLSPWQSWKPIRLANIAFGQGLMVTASQLIQAYAAIANGGKLVPLSYLDRIASSRGKKPVSTTSTSIQQIMKPQTAKSLRNILALIVEEGATKARPSLYSAGGKTGTTQKVDPTTRAYSKTKHLSSFIGIAPIVDPHIVVYVQVDEPRKPLSFGSLWAAPIFRQIVERSLRYLNVAPDRQDAKSSLVISKKAHESKHR